MSSREKILSAIRRHRPEPVELPSLDHDWITYADPRAQFAEVLAAVGGRCVVVKDVGEIDGLLSDLPAYAAANTVLSRVPGVGRSNLDLDAVADPHELSDLDFAVLPAEFAVAENAAVWITDAALKHRVVMFIAQHLALVLPAAEIVQTMHEAYQRIAFAEPGFGAFVSGPSKTADIEQSLVIGAHGPRSLTVFLVEQP